MAVRRALAASVVVPVLAVAAVASAGEHVVTLAPEKTSVTFMLAATGHVVNGTLPVADGQIRIDPDTGVASGEIRMDARRAATGNRLRDRQMHEDVLESERFPWITFRPSRVDGPLSSPGTSRVAIRGTVALHGSEHEVTVPAQVTLSGSVVTVDATVDVPYVDWGLRNPSVLFLRVAHVVTVRVRAEGELRPPITAANR